jgi:hypothetical protein
MSLFPKIQSPCPYSDRLGEVMVGNHCNMCERDVIDISALSDAERMALVAGCDSEICVSYTVAARGALAAAALGAALGMGAPAMAADGDALLDAQVSDPAAQDAADAAADDEVLYPIIVGGLKEPKRTVWLKAPAAARPANMAELPVVYEDEPADQHAPAQAATPQPDPKANPAS